MKPAYGVLLIGGNQTHQEGYARDFAADSRARIVALSDEKEVTPQRARLNKQLAQELEVPYLPDLDAALGRSDVHLASICVEFERRARVAIRCANAGKHVYIDKPLAITNEEAAQLVAAVQLAEVKSQMFSLLRTPWARRAKRLVCSGRLGELVGLHCDLLFAKGIAGTADLSQPRQERFPPSRFSFIDAKRELFTTGVYSIGLLRWLSGKSVERVYARTANYFLVQHQANDVEDFAAVTLEFEGGLTGTLSGGRIGYLSHPSSGPMRLYLIGTKGNQSIDAFRPRLEMFSDAPPWQPGRPDPEDPMGFWRSTSQKIRPADNATWTVVRSAERSDASYFLDCIESGEESDMNVKEGAEILKVLLAAYQSAASGHDVRLT